MRKLEITLSPATTTTTTTNLPTGSAISPVGQAQRYNYRKAGVGDLLIEYLVSFVPPSLRLARGTALPASQRPPDGVVLETSEAWPRGGVHSLAIIYPFSFCLISLTPGSPGRGRWGRGNKTNDFRRDGVFLPPGLAVWREREMPGVPPSWASGAGGGEGEASPSRQLHWGVVPLTSLSP